MRLTKNEMARVIVQGLYAMPALPPADHPEVVKRAARGNVEDLTRQHTLALAAIASASAPTPEKAEKAKNTARISLTMSPEQRQKAVNGIANAFETAGGRKGHRYTLLDCGLGHYRLQTDVPITQWETLRPFALAVAPNGARITLATL